MAEGDDAVSAYLREECRSALAGELALREHVDVEGVHDTRVSIRRVRSTLRVFADLLDPGAVAIDDELRWLAALFGDVRDADVLRERLFAALDDLPAEEVRGSVRDQLDQSIDADREAALRRWRHERDGDRYRSAMSALDSWQREPPLQAGVRAEDVADAASATLASAERTARRRLEEAGEDPVRVHRARKAVKRWRYAADLLGPVLPEAASVAERAARVQAVLGDHQDLVVEAAFLRRPGHDGPTYRLLIARAEQEAAQIRASLRITIDLDMG